jgi:secretion/DNA translocation related TadE-like protein
MLADRGPSALGQRPGDGGSATIWTLAACALIATFGLTALTAAGAVAARHQARTAADLGALAGAPWTVALPDRACPVAVDIARANGADVVSCHVDGVDIRLTVSVPVAGAPTGLDRATATARAGPISAPRATIDDLVAGEPITTHPERRPHRR